jgi:hypothetical protein
MASSLSISRASAVMGTILDRSIDIPRDISFRGNLTLVDRSGSGEAVLRQENLLKLVDINDGEVLSNKAVICNSNKDIQGVNNQTNTGQFIFDKSKDDEEGSIDLVFKRARGSAINKTETFHGNHIGVLSFQPYVGSTYIDSAGIDINTYKTSYSEKYSGSEIIFSNSGGSDINSGKHDSLKIDSRGNLNILKSRELRLNTFTETNYSGFRPSTSTSKPGYILELPAEKGYDNQVLSINKVGRGGKITMTSDNFGSITSATVISGNEGQDYDKDYLPEVNTNVKMTGGKLKENASASNITSNGNHVITSTSVVSGNPTILTINPTPISNGDELTVITIDGNMGTDILNGNNFFVKVTNNISSPTGITNNTTVIGGGGTNTINISNVTTATIPQGTVLTFTFGNNNPETRIVNSEVLLGSSVIELTTTAPQLVTGGTNITEIELYSNPELTIGIDTTGKTSVGAGTHTINADIFLSSISSNINNYYNGWTIETINPNSERLIVNYNNKSKKAILSSRIPDTSTVTQYKLIQGHGLSKLNRINNVYTLDTFSSLDSTTLSTEENYYINWTIITDIEYNGENVIYKGTITSYIYDPNGSVIEVNWVNTIPLYHSNQNEVIINNVDCSLTNEIIVPASIKIKNIDSNGSLITGTNGIEIINGGSGYIPNQTIVVDLPSHTKLQWVSQNASSFTSPNSVITAGKGLTGGGNISGNITIDLDLSTHDAAGTSSNAYQSIHTDKILIYNPVSGESHMPDITNFLNSITGVGLSTDSNTGDIIVSNSQNIVSNISDNFKIYASTNNQKTHYLNIGKDDLDNINFKGEYKTTEDLGILPNTTITAVDENSITISNRTTVIIPQGTVINFTYSNQTATETAVVSSNIAAGSNIIFLTSIPTNISLTVNITEITGISANTTVVSGSGTNTITISNNTTEIITQGTILTFTFPNQNDQTRVVSSDVSSGQNIITLTSASPLPLDITINITPENYLDKTIITTNSTKTNNDSTIQFDIGNTSELVNINKYGLFVNNGIVESITILDGGNGYQEGDVLVIAPPPDGDTFPSGNQSDYTAQGKIILNSAGEITNVIILYRGLGYSSSTPPTVTVSPRGSSSGNGASLTSQVSEERYISGEINTYDVRYDGYFKDLYISGDQNFQGTLKVTGQGAVELGKPSNLDFSENDSNFLFGFDVGSNGSIRNTTNKDVTLIGYKTGFNSTLRSEFNTMCGSNCGTNNTGPSLTNASAPFHETDNPYNEEGTKNTYYGYDSGSGGVISHNSVCIGYTSGSFLTGSYNTALGSGAGYASSDDTSGHSGDNNVYLGYNSQSRGGSNNLFCGANSGKLASSSDGVFLGYNSGLNSSGNGNVLIGYESGYTATTSLHNVLIGYQSGYNVSTNDTTISPNYSGNTMLGYKSGYNVSGDSSRNIIIGPNAGPPDDSGTNTHHNKLYISTRGESLNPLILGDQDTENSQTLKFNADVTISNENSNGNLEVQGGEIIFWGKSKAYNGGGSSWKIFSPGSTSGNDTNLVISNHSEGLESPSSYNDTIVIGNLSKARGSRSTIIGSNAGRGTSASQNDNTFIGYESGSYGTSSVVKNTFIGAYSGKGHSTNENICIGYNTGFNPSNPSTSNRTLIIDTMGSNVGPRGEESLIYGDQNNTLTPTLSFNAEVTVRKSIRLLGPESNNGMTDGYTSGHYSGTPYKWFLQVPKGYLPPGADSNNPKSRQYWDRNIQIGTENYGISSGSQTDATYGNILIGAIIGDSSGNSYGRYNTLVGDGIAYGRTNIGNFNTVFGVSAMKFEVNGAEGNTYMGNLSGYNTTTGNNNTIIGRSSGYYIRAGQENVCVGYQSGHGWNNSDDNLNGSRNTYLGSYAGTSFGNGVNNVAIGYNTGPTGLTTLSNRLYIDVGYSSQISSSWGVTTIANAAKGENSLIYGNQSGSTHTLSLNADVTVKNGSNSSGNLDIEGTLTCGSLSTALSDITFQDFNIDVNPTTGRTNFGYNLFFTNNSHNLNFGDLSGNTFFGTSSDEFSLTTGDENTMFGKNNLMDLTTGHRNTIIGTENAMKFTSASYNAIVGRYNMRTGLTTPSFCSCIGYNNAGSSTGSPQYNVYLGSYNGTYLNGDNNVAIGRNCLQATTQGRDVNYSVCIGNDSGKECTGDYNYMIGHTCGTIVSGTANVGLGLFALRYVKSGSNNIGIGYNTCQGTGNGTNSFQHNVALGFNALKVISTGSNNISIGQSSGQGTTSGNINVFVGQNTGRTNTTGSNNTFLGPHAGYGNTSGSDNIAIGFNAGKHNTSGIKNIYIGYSAGPRTGQSPSETTTNNKIYIDNDNNGANSLIYGDMSTGTRSVKINGTLTVTGSFSASSFGSISGDITGGLTVPSNKTISIPSINQISVTSSNTNMYLGYQSAYSGIRSGSSPSNTFLGYRTGRQATSSTDNLGHNTYIGNEAGYYGTTSNLNTAIGSRALFQNQTGIRNTSCGFYTGYYVKGNYNTCLGYNAGPTGPTTLSYRLYIDPVSRRGGDSLIYGIGATSQGVTGTNARHLYLNANTTIKYNLSVSGNAGGNSGWNSSSDISLKKDITKIDEGISDKIYMLNPVNYIFKIDDKKDVGFIAQELKQVFPLIVGKRKDGLLTIDYARLTPYIVKGMQEQNKRIKELENKLDEEKQKRENMEKFFREEIEKLRKEILNK